jgi:hypothetical protein
MERSRQTIVTLWRDMCDSKTAGQSTDNGDTPRFWIYCIVGRGGWFSTYFYWPASLAVVATFAVNQNNGPFNALANSSKDIWLLRLAHTISSNHIQFIDPRLLQGKVVVLR